MWIGTIQLPQLTVALNARFTVYLYSNDFPLPISPNLLPGSFGGRFSRITQSPEQSSNGPSSNEWSELPYRASKSVTRSAH